MHGQNHIKDLKLVWWWRHEVETSSYIDII